MKKYIQVVKFENDEVVKSIDVTGKSERQIDKIDAGINWNMNHDDYYTRFYESDIDPNGVITN